MSFILYTILLIICIWYINSKFIKSYELFYGSAYPSMGFYTTSIISDSISDYSLYRVDVYTMEKNNMGNLMIHIMPQDVYYFLEDEIMLFHPKNSLIMQIAKYYECPDNFELAYIFSKKYLFDEASFSGNKLICHRNLNYMTKLYKYRIYSKTFTSLPDISLVLALILKNTGIYKLLKGITNK